VARLSLSSPLGGLFGRAPEYGRFYDLFRQAGENVEDTTRLLLELLESWPDGAALRHEIVDREHRGDALTHDILHDLHRKSVVPLPSREAVALAGAVDDIVDLAEEASDYMGLYGIEAPMEQSVALARILHSAGATVSSALAKLAEPHSYRNETVELNRLEEDGDRVARAAIASLFAGGIDPLVIVRWKDVFECLEQAIDACDRVGNLLEGISLQSG
jgi:uncharacterized protein Yka (UPF0111/DUF47 family)